MIRPTVDGPPRRRLMKVVLAVFAQVLAADAGQAVTYRAPRTADGAPDLQGVWTNASVTRLERPEEAKTLVVPDADVAALEHRLALK